MHQLVLRKSLYLELPHVEKIHFQNFSRHVLFLSIVLGSLATPATTYVMIGIDFVLNLIHGGKIVYSWNYSTKENARETGRNIHNIFHSVYLYLDVLGYSYLQFWDR